MKIRFIAVAMGLSLALCAARANDILAITETGENFNDLIVTFNGTPLAGVQITGAADNWTVELPSGYSWPSFVGNGFQFGEPDNALSNNQLLFSQPTFLIWQSDISVGFPSTPGPMNIGAIGIARPGNRLT
jgi:hypothetical protein